VSEYEEIEHPDEMPPDKRAPELDPEALEEIVAGDLPEDAPVPEESRGE
jgi:hypothetical protein